MHPTVIIFDWDDTIIDIGNILASCQYLACKDTPPPPETFWSLPPKSAFYSQKGARFLETIIPSIFSAYNPTKPSHTQWSQACYKLFRDYYKDHPKKLITGVENMLLSLHQAGYTLAIATNKSRDLLVNELSQHHKIENLFETIVCGDDASVNKQFKPQPTMLNFIRDKHPHAQNFIMVGDQPSDIVAAKNSHNMPTIGIGDITHFENIPPSICMDSAAHITPDIITQLLTR